MAEMRRDQRVSLPLEAHCEGLSGKYSARLSDISLGGCYVESIALVTTGESIHFEIQLPTGRWLPLKGEVAYHHPNLGFGIRFIELSDLQREMLAYIIEYGREA